MNGAWYCTREDVMSATDNKASARMGADIDRDIESASRAAEGFLRRRFYPWTGTRYFDWPGLATTAWRLRLGDHDINTVTTLTVGGAVVTAYFLEPDSGPPYSVIEFDRSSSDWASSSGITSQRAVAIAGQWGKHDQAPAGALAEVLDAVETGVDVTDSSAIGVGSLLTVGTERMIVTGKGQLTTGTTTTAGLDAKASTVAVPVVSGAAVNVGERILIDAETMQVVDKAGNTLVVDRAADGSVLAAHLTAATVYAPRSLTVVRGVLGTAAAIASLSAPITVWVPPGLVNALTVAYAVRAAQQRSGGYTVDDENALNALQARAFTAHGRASMVLA